MACKRTRVDELEIATPSSGLSPATIDPVAAISAFKSQRGLMLELVRHCLPSLSNSLFGETIISRDACEDASNSMLNRSQRSVALLDCVEARIQVRPVDFTKVVQILESDSFLEALADNLVQSYDDFSNAPAGSIPQAIPSALSHYRTYLKSVYKNSPVSPENKWPPTPSKEYIRLSVGTKGLKSRDEYIGYTLQGNIEQVLNDGLRREISIEQILEPDIHKGKLKLVLVEGAPGIGKSTLAWELCRKWEEFACMKQYSLVVLLRLREKEVQRICRIGQLFYRSRDKEAMVDEVDKNQGKSILFILDGFDELPKPLQKVGFLLDLIGGRVLPESTILVTSRPSATAELLTSCRPQVEKHVEILGFTQESVEAYASSVLSSQPEKLANFKTYISASENPAINSLMYIPLNAAIVIEIYANSKCDSFLPHTLTELYIQLSLTILNRHLPESDRITRFEDLPNHPLVWNDFLRLSRLAFEGMVNQEIIFHDLPLPLVHFGFLDAVSALYGGGGVSYNFLHLTVQEFFAAYHISRLDSGGLLELFKRYGKDQRWNIVWRFVAGLTEFKCLSLVDDTRFFIQRDEKQRMVLVPLLVQCLFEAQTIKCSHFKKLTVKYDRANALDLYAFGYCICNCLTGVYLNISLHASDLGSFLSGLNNSSSCRGNIERLEVNLCSFSVAKFKTCCALHSITSISFTLCMFTASDLFHLSELIPYMRGLQELKLYNNTINDQSETDSYDAILRILQQVSYSEITSLTFCQRLPWSQNLREDYYCALKELICLPYGRLTKLRIGCYKSEREDTLMKLLSVNSSLKTLGISLTPTLPLRMLKSNTCLTKLKLYGKYMCCMIPQIVEILKDNKTLQHLELAPLIGVVKTDDSYIGNCVKTINDALSGNKTLHLLEGYLSGSDDYVSQFVKFIHKGHELDPRITWKSSLVGSHHVHECGTWFEDRFQDPFY